MCACTCFCYILSAKICFLLLNCLFVGLKVGVRTGLGEGQGEGQGVSWDGLGWANGLAAA